MADATELRDAALPWLHGNLSPKPSQLREDLVAQGLHDETQPPNLGRNQRVPRSTLILASHVCTNHDERGSLFQHEPRSQSLLGFRLQPTPPVREQQEGVHAPPHSLLERTPFPGMDQGVPA